jgi:beta-L-arabinobiosidase
MRAKTRKGLVTSVASLVALATLAAGGGTALAAEIANPNSAMGYPTFYGDKDPIPSTGVTYNPATSYLGQVFEQDKAQGAGTDTDHDFYVDKILMRTGATPTGTGKNEAGEYRYEGADGNDYLFTRGRAAYMFTHTPGKLGFVGDAAYWDQTSQNGFTIDVSVDGKNQTLTEVTAERKQTPSYFTTVFRSADQTLSVTEVKYITNNNVMVANLTVESTQAREVTLTAASPFAQSGEDGAQELTGRYNVKNNLTTIYPRFSGNDFTVQGGKLVNTVALNAGEPATTKIQLGLIANELPDSTSEYEARLGGDLADPAASYKDSVTTYNQWWVDNAPYVETPEHNIDKTVVYRWWLSRFNMLDANMPGNTFQYPTSIEGVLGYNNQIVLTSGMFINDTKWFRNPEYSYGTWVSAGQTAKEGKSGNYYYHDNPGDPANWNHSYTQYITRAGWDSYKVHGGPSTVAETLADYGSEDVKGLLNSQKEPDDNDNQNANSNKLIDWSWWSMTGNDADAVSFSEPGRSGQRMDRADGSANMWANANAAAKAYKAAGDSEKAAEMQKIADGIKQDVLNNLWDQDDKLLLHKWINDGAFAKYKELNNYYPYSEGLMPTGNDDYNEALRLFADADEFPIFPFFTANQADKKALNFPGSNNFSIINATPLLQIYSAGIRNYDAADNNYITNESFKKLLYWVASSHYQGGDNRYPDQNEFWNMDNNSAGSDIPSKNADASKNGGKITYRSWIHHTQLGTTNWTMIEDVAGMVPREDNKIELNPIAIPDWNHFTVNNLSYHGQDVSIVWNNDGYYDAGGAPKGYTLYLDGKPVFTSDKLAHLIYDPATGRVNVEDKSGAKVTVNNQVDLKAANQVTYDSTSRVTDIFAKSGTNVDSASQSQVNVAKGAQVKATYEASGYPATNAVDGTNVMESFWGTKGSENGKDSIDVTFKGGAQDIDDIRLYYYQTSSSQTISGYGEPSVYKLEYQSEDGAWHAIDGQVRTPAYAGANYNRIQFPTVHKAKAIRVTFTPQAGQAVGLKEIQAYNTGITPSAASKNQAPQVDAYAATSTSSGASLVGTVKDDGLPTDGDIATKWTMVSGPENGTAKFVNDASASTTATFNLEGDYVLKLTASDGELSAEKEVSVHGVPSDGTVNIASQSKASASYTNGSQPADNAKKVIDGQVMYANTPNETWNNWGDNTGKEPTLQLTWSGKVPLKKAKLFFWTDGGGVPMTKEWKLQYADANGDWQNVKLADGQSYTVKQNEGNEVKFADTIETDKLRVVFAKGAIVGVSEFEAYALDPVGVDDVNRMVQTGTKAADLNLPATVSASYTDGSRRDLAVAWGKVVDDQLAQDSEFTIAGTITGALSGAKAVIGVRSDADSQTSGTAQPVEQTVYQNSASVTLPATVPVRFPNGMLSDRKVTWNDADVKAMDLTQLGEITVSGTAEGSSGAAKITIHVVADPNAAVTPDPDPEPLEGWIEGKASATETSAAASWSPAEGKLSDGVLVDDTWPDADDQDVNAKTWGTWGAAVDGMYAQYTWDQPVTIDSSRAQFWANFSTTDDTKGGLEIPQEWKIQYLAEDGSWKDAENATYNTVRNDPTHRATQDDGWSTATFDKVTTSSLRLVLTPHTGTGTFGTATAEWGVHAVKNEPTPDPVDKTALQAALAAAAGLDQSIYTAASWSGFQQIVTSAQAVFDNAAATSGEVAAAVTSLEDGQKTLVVKATDALKAALQAAVDKANGIDRSLYTTESLKGLDQAAAAAQKVLSGAEPTRAEVLDAQKALDAANGKLVKKVSKESLKASLDKANGIDRSKYTAQTLGALDKAIAAAQKVYDNDKATQADVDAAQDQLDAAVAALALINPEQKPGSDQPGVDQPGSDQRPNAEISKTGTAVAAVGIAALLLAAAGALLLKRRRDASR